MLEFLLEKLERSVPKWIRNCLEEAKDVLECFCSSDEKYVRYLYLDKEQLPILCNQPGNPRTASKDVMGQEEEISAILTSGTLKAGADFCAPTGHRAGSKGRVQEWQSPHFPMRRTVCYTCQRRWSIAGGSREEAVMIANHIHS